MKLHPRSGSQHLPAAAAALLLFALSLPSTQAGAIGGGVQTGGFGVGFGGGSGGSGGSGPAGDWRYLLVGSNDLDDFVVHAGFVAPTYVETSGWASGSMPFSTFGDGACGFTGNTDFPAADLLLVRKTVMVPSGFSQLQFDYRADNEIWAWVDGNLVFQASHGFCDGYQTQTYTVSGPGPVLVAVLVQDLGSPGHLDLAVTVLP